MPNSGKAQPHKRTKGAAAPLRRATGAQLVRKWTIREIFMSSMAREPELNRTPA